MDFITGTLASILAIVLVYFFNRLKKISQRKSTCEREFENQAEAETEILEKLNNSAWANIFVCRGYSLIESDRKYYSGVRNIPKCKILISKPKEDDGSYNSEVIKRVDELSQSKTIDAYTSNIEEVIRVLSKDESITIRQHQEPIVFRMYLFPDTLYLSFFEDNIGASKSKVYKYKDSSPFYIAYIKYFERIWEKSK